MLGNIFNSISMRYRLPPKAQLHLSRNNAHNLQVSSKKSFQKSYELKVADGKSMLRQQKGRKQFSMMDFKRAKRLINNSTYLDQQAQKENECRKIENWLNSNCGNNFKIVQKFPYANSDIKQISMLDEQESKSTHDLMDIKFNKLLDFNLENQLQLSRQIESKFLIVEETSFQPNTVQEKFNAHQQLLEEENFYIREQLITFALEIQTTRHENNQLLQENSQLKLQLSQMRELRQSLQKFILDNQERWFKLSTCFEQSNVTIANLRTENKLLQQYLESHQRQNKQLYQNLKRKQQSHGLELERLAEEKDKQIRIMAEEIMEKQNQIKQLNQSLTTLNNKLKYIQEKSQFQEKIKQQFRYNKQNIFENFQMELNQENGSKKLSLSMAEAEKLMNIIEEKQEVQKMAIRAMHCKLSNLQSSHQQQMFKINQKIVEYQRYIDQLQQNNQQLKGLVKNNESNTSMNHLIQQQIVQKVPHVQQEQQLQDLLSRCLDQLEKLQEENSQLHQQIFILHQQSNDYKQFDRSRARRNSIS